MINNLLKVVGVENSNSSPSSSNPNAAYSSPGSSSNVDYYAAPPLSAGATSTASASSGGGNSMPSYRHPSSPDERNNGNNFASAIGGFLNNLNNNGTAMVAGALDSTGVMGHKSWTKGSKSYDGGGSGGRYRNAGGRGYYTDGNNVGRREQQQHQQHPIHPGGSSDSMMSSQRGGHAKMMMKKGGKGGVAGHNSNHAANNGMYQGRKIVAGISHLYQVVDDKQAYDNYDTLMEITRNASAQARERMMSESYHSEGGQSSGSDSGSSYSRRRGRRNRGGHGGRDDSQQQKQNWARAKEEELIDRMLSQFPEFGTNRPTPFTVMDDGDEDDNTIDDSSLLHHSVVSGGGTKMRMADIMYMGVPPISSKRDIDESASSHALPSNNPLSPSRFLTDDASDIIGRFFFGTPDGGGGRDSTAAPTSGAADGEGSGVIPPEDFRRTASFGSTSSVSTMTSVTGGAGRGAAAAVEEGPTSRNGENLTGAVRPQIGQQYVTPVTDHAGGDIGKEEVWDQDEIDLWTATPKLTPTNGSGGGGSVPGAVSYDATRGRGATTPAPQHDRRRRPNGEGDGENDNSNAWASRRRRQRQRRTKGHDWDALRHHLPSSTAVKNHVTLTDPNAGTTPVLNLGPRSFHPQQTLLTALQPDPQPTPTSKDSPKESSPSKQIKSKEGGGGGSVIVDNGKQHWMPDNLCKHCYSCEATFTLLRRKHHCRVCGMIFCSACSAYFVQISSQDDLAGGGGGATAATDGKSSGKQGGANQGTMRTCKMCYDHLSERGLGVIMRGRGSGGTATGDNAKSESGAGLKSSPSSEVMNAKKQSPPLSVDKPEATATLTRKGSALLPLSGHTSKNSDSTSNQKITDENATAATSAKAASASEITDQFAGFHGSGGDALSGDFHALNITKQRLEMERLRREEQERMDAVAAAAAEEEAAAALAESKAKGSATGGGGSGRSSFLSKSRTSLRQLKWKGGSSSNLESTGSSAETIKAGSNAVEVSVGGDAAAAGDAAGETEGGGVVRAAASTVENKSGIEEALFGPGQSKDAKLSAKIHLGMVAADYLEKLGRELLKTDAPLLLEEIKKACSGAGASSSVIETKLTDLWVNTLMSLATRCCATVEPDVKNGDLLDIRPYCKLKVIPGGSVEDSAYMSGIVFHKNVSHKRMARIIPHAKIMMLSGGIEYTRTENRIASLDTLIEQEERYMEILVTKIFKLKPDVLIVGKSVCRKAQELLLRTNIVLVQYVKPTLMTRIARQTGATMLSSIDHVMSSTILGYCRRFRLVSFRDNDVWVDDDMSSRASISSDQKSVPVLLSQNLPNHERQAALAARKLGEGVLDGMAAVTLGLAKRGVVKTYVMIEGCPKELGCTVVLRGASRPALKMIKRVLRFLINCSYNMKLETCYILERCCRLPPSYKIPQTPCCSSSLCVDFGQPPNNRKARPWNGGKNDPAQRSLSGKITPLDHQAILITSVWMTDKTQCCPAEVKGICYYSMQDVSLGQFLRDSCFNLSLKCQNPSCKKSVLDHSLSFIHNDGLINISVERLDNPIPAVGQKDGSEASASTASASNKQQQEESSPSPTVPDYEPIATWTYCTKCDQVVTPLVFLSKQTWQWSFGKFLEVFFYNRDAIINAPGHRCSCRMQSAPQLFFGCGSLAARFTYEKILPYSVFCRRHLPFDEIFHRGHSLQDLEHISTTSSLLFIKYDKQIDAISRETRDLFGSAVNKPEHLQAVLSELNLVSAEVDKSSKVLREKIMSVTAKYSKAAADSGSGKSREYNDALFNFPWYSRRYLFMLASAWNERLSAAGQALSAMKKIQHAGGSGRGDSAVVPAIVGDASTEDVIEGMKRIRMLQETYSRNYNVAKMTMPRSHKGETGGLFEGNILPDGRVATLEQEAEIDDEEFLSDMDNDIDFEDDIDADVLASRNRVYSPRASSSKGSSRQRKKTSEEELPNIPDQSTSPLGFASNYDNTSQLEMQGKSKTVTTAGGAVKSALTRFFNRGGNKEDPYIVDLGFFGKGRPRLPPGIGGMVIPVFDDQPSTIIAHSLASSDYDVQFKQFVSATSSQQPESSRSSSEKRDEQPTRKDIERRMLGRNKSHIKHTFRDFDEKGQQLCKFVCTTFWSVQFNAVRQAFMNPHISSKDSSSSSSGDAGGASGSTKSSATANRLDIEKSYIRSLATSFAWAASGGKSGAAFSRTTDDRFVIKCISRTELQMFLDCAPAYFEYLSKAFFHGLPTVLCKIVGVYQIGYHNRVTGKRTMEQVAVMQNIFFGRKISKIFDLKGSLRGRFTRQGNVEKEKKSSKKSSSKQYRRSKSENTTSDSDSFSSCEDDDDDSLSTSSEEKASSGNAEKGEKTEKSESIPTLLDGDFLEFTNGRPLPLTDRAKAVFHMSILNDTLFLSIINVLDYSILVGIDEEKMELVVGIIDFMRQYDILKQMERVGKSLPMVVGSEAPTIIQPPLYKARFTNAMERYFMTVPSKWTTI